jgi:hypothetical protein
MNAGLSRFAARYERAEGVEAVHRAADNAIGTGYNILIERRFIRCLTMSTKLPPITRQHGRFVGESLVSLSARLLFEGLEKSLIRLARPTRLELVTSAFGGATGPAFPICDVASYCTTSIPLQALSWQASPQRVCHNSPRLAAVLPPCFRGISRARFTPGRADGRRGRAPARRRRLAAAPAPVPCRKCRWRYVRRHAAMHRGCDSAAGRSARSRDLPP